MFYSSNGNFIIKQNKIIEGYTSCADKETKEAQQKADADAYRLWQAAEKKKQEDEEAAAEQKRKDEADAWRRQQEAEEKKKEDAEKKKQKKVR